MTMAELSPCVVCLIAAGTVTVDTGGVDPHTENNRSLMTRLEMILEEQLAFVGPGVPAMCEKCVSRLAQIEEYYQIVQKFRQDFHNTQTCFVQKSNCMYAEVVGDREHHQRGLNWMKEARDMVEERLVDSPCCLRKLPEADSVSNHDSKEVEQHKSKEAEEHKNSHHDRKEAEKHTSHHDEEAQHKTSHHDNEEAEHKTSHHDEEVQHKTSRHENKEAEQNKTYNHDTEEPEEHKNSPHCCRECGSGIGFVTWEDLQQHKVQRHGGHKCSTCGIVVKTRRTLRLHMHAHMDTVHECMECGQKFKRPRYLRVHQRESCSKRHLKKPVKDTPLEKLQKCKVCDKGLIVDAEHSASSHCDCRLEGKLAQPVRSAPEETVAQQVQSAPEEKVVQKSSSLEQSPLPVLQQTASQPRRSDHVLYPCPACSSVYHKKGHLANHINSCHWKSDGSQYVCRVCDAKFVLMAELQQHMKHRHTEQLYRCCYCEKDFAKRHLLSRHKVNMHRTEDGIGKKYRYECPFCAVDFTSKSMLNHHINEDHRTLSTHGVPPSSICSFKCHCGKRFYTREILETHTLRNHQASYDCPVCHKSFTLKKNLTQHLKLHTEVTAQTKNPSRTDGSNQMKRKCFLKKRKTSHLCNVCGYTCVAICTFQNHMVQHEGTSEYKCEECGAIFAHPSQLVYHQNQHTRPFICEYCGVNFSAKVNLTAHRRRHTGEQPYECHLCGETFRWRLSLKQHLWSEHKQGKPRQEYDRNGICPVCSKPMQTSGFARHFRRMHPEISYKRKYATQGRTLAARAGKHWSGKDQMEELVENQLEGFSDSVEVTEGSFELGGSVAVLASAVEAESTVFETYVVGGDDQSVIVTSCNE